MKSNSNLTSRSSSYPLKAAVDRYNLKNPEERYQFRRLARSLVKWYGYLTQVVRAFDSDMQREYIYLRYLINLLPADWDDG